jgi:deazaflavin-dependent oxidoreductase (nitroreductase family)
MTGESSHGSALARRERPRRARHLVFWRLVNPLNKALVGVAPWWVILETQRRTGARRQTPLARGPRDGTTTWLIAVHGRHALWVGDLSANPQVRVRLRRHWYEGRATVEAYDPAVVRRFGRYARMGPALLGIEPALVRVELG